MTAVVHGSPQLHRIATKLGLVAPNINVGIQPPTREKIQSSVQRLITIIKEYSVDVIVLVIPSRYLWLDTPGKEIHQRTHIEFGDRLTFQSVVVADMRSQCESAVSLF